MRRSQSRRAPRGKGRNDIAIRLATLRRMLDGRDYRPHLDDLAEQLEVHPRTIRRDLQALATAGEDIPPARPRAEIDPDLAPLGGW